MNYVDANVFLYPVLYPDDKKAETAKEAFFKSDETPLTTSALTWDEVVWVVKKHMGLDQAKIEGRKMLTLPNLFIAPADLALLGEAQKLVEKYNVKPRDSIHAATAIKHKVIEFITNDKDFLAIKELKVKLL